MIINSILKGHTVYYLFVYYLTLLKVTNALELCHSSLELSSPNRCLAAIRLGGTRHRKKRKERIGYQMRFLYRFFYLDIHNNLVIRLFANMVQI